MLNKVQLRRAVKAALADLIYNLKADDSWRKHLWCNWTDPDPPVFESNRRLSNYQRSVITSKRTATLKYNGHVIATVIKHPKLEVVLPMVTNGQAHMVQKWLECALYEDFNGVGVRYGR